MVKAFRLAHWVFLGVAHHPNEKVDDVGQNGKMLQALGGHSAPDHTDDLECVLTRPGFSPHSSIPLILLLVIGTHDFREVDALSFN